MGFFDLLKSDPDAPAVPVDPETSAELRRLANLFLISAITLVLFLLATFASILHVTFLKPPITWIWGGALLVGWAVTYVYGLIVVLRTRRWAWIALAAIPITCVPAGVAYAWFRRVEIENQVFGDEQDPPQRQRRGGRGRR